MNLLNLPPEIQEEILLLPAAAGVHHNNPEFALSHK